MAKTVRKELELSLVWVRENPELAIDSVVAFVNDAQGRAVSIDNSLKGFVTLIDKIERE